VLSHESIDFGGVMIGKVAQLFNWDFLRREFTAVNALKERKGRGRPREKHVSYCATAIFRERGILLQ
jgi:hypothetical protein